MSQVVLQPSANKGSREHYRDTIESPVDLVAHRDLLGEAMYKHLAALFPTGYVPMWGVTPGVGAKNQPKWERLELGATVLFTASGRIFGRGVIAARFHNAPLARRLWREDERGDTWEYMYALHQVKREDIPYAQFNAAVGYSANFIPQGFMVMDEDRSTAFLEAFPAKEFSPEVADAVEAVEEIANPRRKFGRRLSAAENKAIEEHAVRVVREHLENELGFTTQDVGATESYDVHATRDGSTIKLEVKGTTSDGAAIILTANEVTLHLAEHPHNALAVVRGIVLDRDDGGPVASGGELDLTMGWELDRDRLQPIAYRYSL